ncbi:uncharacterized protein EV420DRAFT_1644127 [Desarmillaria tabescens]|uniref:Uncharacterized protein n=1 Tax=Armillaria tabescens TaxID=1929756 RepID=A0AA39N4R0_ARMTA|nr:uncharacterized protein EV420DRAFT_1644127 [Desarmillaria tabescens]KAK0457369.1 hypothetical protein EV420DRAFT_1644127 [Desarmillaria tabescens]
MSEEQTTFDYLEATLNQAILGALGHVSSKQKLSKARNFMAFLIILLYMSATIFLAFNWAYVIYAYIKKGQTYVTVVQALGSSAQAQTFRWVSGITSGINTDIADTITIWRCWIVWGQRWTVVILPILLFLSQGGAALGGPYLCALINAFDSFCCFALHADLYDTSNGGNTPGKSEINWTTMYLSFSLATTLLCTTLIIYRIVTVRRSPDGISAAARVYRGIVEILVESALLYAISLILSIVLIARGGAASAYPQIIYVTITGIAPTLIMARVASGQARPNDSWQASHVSALQFGSGTPENTQTDGIMSTSGRENDLEHGEPNHYD